MNNPRLAARYAKSLIEIAQEQQLTDAVYADIKMLRNITKSNPDFVAVLRSPVIASDKKEKIINAVAGEKISKLTKMFINLLTVKTREGNLPEIITAFIEQYNALKNIQTVKLTTATEVSDELKQQITDKVKQNGNFTVELESVVNEELIGGFKLEAGGTLIDASIQRDLNDVRKQFLGNDYIYSIR